MYVHALDASYVELWRSLSSGIDRYLAVRVERAGGLDRILFVAGDRFQHSTPPWRAGRHLEFIDGIVVANDSTGLTPRVASAERWPVLVNTLTKAELVALFPPQK